LINYNPAQQEIHKYMNDIHDYSYSSGIQGWDALLLIRDLGVLLDENLHISTSSSDPPLYQLHSIIISYHW